MTRSEQSISNALIVADGHRGDLPLLSILGMPVLVRTLFALERAGIADAYVMAGDQSDKLKSAVDRMDRLEIEIHWIEHASQLPESFDEPVVLVMGGRVFEPGVVATLRKNSRGFKGIDFAVDRGTDTGIALASPTALRRIQDSIAQTGGCIDPSGVRALTDDDLVRDVEVGGLIWHAIERTADALQAERKLISGVRKSSDGPISKNINRPISTTISRFLSKTPVTPNQVTLVTLIIGLATGVVATIGGYWGFLATGLLFQLTSILDGVDGELAKLTYRGSRSGEWFDTISDNITYVAFLLGLIVGVYRSDIAPVFFYLGILGLVLALLTFVNIYTYLALQKKSGSFLAVNYGFEQGGGWLKRFLRVVQYLGKRDLMAFLVMLLAIAGQIQWVLALFGVGAATLLFPASVKATVGMLWRERRARAAQAVETVKVGRPSGGHTRPDPRVST
ncbi:MAG: CDP-alcohol phosphatidyltransferase family protein [Gemmatimonadales bacterium]